MFSVTLKRKNIIIIAVSVVAIALVLAYSIYNINNSGKNRLSDTSSNGSGSGNSVQSEITAEQREQIMKLIDEMSIDEKIGQMVIGSYKKIDDILPVIEKNHLGGVILYSENIADIEKTKQDIATLKNSSSKVPLFISVDEEGGRVSRLPAEINKTDSALTVGDKNDETYAYNSGVKIAQSIKELGFNLDFAPVLDIFSNSKNTVIADRAYGKTPDRVSKIGMQVINGIRSQGIIPTAKHFPGHGDTELDSHTDLPIVNKTLDELKAFELKPFVDAIENDIEMIMVAHVVLSKVEALPSTLSRKVVTGILREELNYNGVIITDDIMMDAIADNYDVSGAALMAVNAGCDIVLAAKDASNSALIVNALKNAYRNDALTEERIDKSVYRILELKKRYGILD